LLLLLLLPGHVLQLCVTAFAPHLRAAALPARI
jgi:hypothetical protein